MASEDVSQMTSTTLAFPKPGTVQYKAKKYHQHFTSRLVSYRERERFTDVVLKCGHLELPCHRVVLAAASSYFDALFDEGSKDGKPVVVELKTFKPEIVSTIVDFIYTAEVTLSTKNVQNIRSACDELELKELKEGCDSFLAERVEPANCLGLYVFSKVHDLQQTLQKTTMCMLQKLDDILRLALDAEFKALDEDHVIEYISNDELEVQDEVMVFKFVERWVGIDPSTRGNSAGHLMEHVRLAFCSPENLCGIIEESPIMQSKECLILLNEAKTYQLVPAKRPSLVGERTRPRYSLEQLVLIDGENKAQDKCWYLERKEQVWKEFTTLPVPALEYFQACLIDNTIILTGGWTSTDGYTNASWAFSLEEKKWQALPSMKDKRCHHAVVSVGGEVYAVGGYSRNGKLNQVEKLDTKRQGWTQLAPMKFELEYHVAVNADQHLIVMAGVSKSCSRSQITQMYDIGSGCWSRRADMPKPCEHGAAVYWRKKVYVVGGNQRCCMSYDPGQNAWTIHAQPEQRRYRSVAVVWKGKILLCGGGRDDAEEYDPGTGTWTTWSKTLPAKLKCHSLLNMNTIITI